MSKPDTPRAAYVATATRIFATSGYHGTSLAAVAVKAGVTKQALLHFFGTKERLYAEVLNQLAARQTAAIDRAYQPDPAGQLVAYFEDLAKQTTEEANDLQLVARALLDSDKDARIWPLKPYLDRLVALARETPGGRDLSEASILAALSQFIGVLQYLALSSIAMTGMYGTATAQAADLRTREMVLDAVRAFVLVQP